MSGGIGVWTFCMSVYLLGYARVRLLCWCLWHITDEIRRPILTFDFSFSCEQPRYHLLPTT